MAVKKTKSRKRPAPVVLSINICDTIIRDQISKKVSLIGLFGSIRCPSFPARHPKMHVYVSLTDGHGKHKINIRFVSLETGTPVVSMEGEIEFPNPLQVVDLNLEWNNLKFDKSGVYSVEVLCDNVSIGSRKFNVEGQKQLPPTRGAE